MRVRINRASHTPFLAATLLAGAAWLVVPAALAPVSAEEGQTTQEAPPQAEAPAQEPAAQEPAAKESETGGHGGMMGGDMQKQGETHEGGMQGCKMMGGDHAGMTGGDHAGMTGEGMQGCKMMQGGMHEGGMQGGGMQGGMQGGMMAGDHSGMKHDDKDAAKDKPSGMGEMRKMMHEMMAEMAARADERLAALKTELAITDAQLPQWTAFADAVRAAARSMEQTHKEMTASEAAAPAPMPKPAPAAAAPDTGGDKSYPGMEAVKKIAPPAPAPERPAGSLPAKLEAHEKMLTRHLDSLKAIEAALTPLYATFDDKQKAIADELKIGPMGVM